MAYAVVLYEVLASTFDVEVSLKLAGLINGESGFRIWVTCA